MEKRPEEDDPLPHDGQNVVEEIEHAVEQAVEQVVEHVPEPVRWTVRKLILLVLLALVALVVLVVFSTILYFANRTELVAKELTLFLNGTLSQRSNLVVEVADIRGNPFSDVRLLRARVRYRDGDAPVLLETPEIRLTYSAWRLFRSHQGAVDVVVKSPVIRLSRRSDGRLRLPLWKTAGSVRESGRVYDVRLRLQDARLLAPDPLGAYEQLYLDALISTTRATRVEVRDLRWKTGPFASRDVRLNGEIVAGDSVQFHIRRLVTPDLTLAAHGGWRKGSTERALHADIARVRWKWLSEASGSKFFDVSGEGRITADVRVDRTWLGRFDSEFTWDGLAARGRSEFSWNGTQLDLAPLSVTSKAGDLEGRVAYSKQEWEVGGKVRHGDPSQWAMIKIFDWPKGDLDGEFLYHVESRLGGVADLDATLGESEIQGWRADHATVKVHFPVVGPDSFTVHMDRLGGQVSLVGASREGGWDGRYTAERFPLQEWPDGRATGIRGTVTRAEGTVRGGGGELHVTGVLDGADTDWLGAHMARWRLEDVNGRLLPTPDLTTRARLEDVMFLGVHFDSAATPLRLHGQSVDLQELQAGAGDTLLAAAGAGEWFEGGWRLRFDRATLASQQFEWQAVPPVTLSGDPGGVMFDRLKARDGTAELDITGRWGVPGGSFDWAGQVRALDLARTGMPRELGLAGRADARLEIKGRAEEPRWSLEAQVSRPGWQGHVGDTLTLALEGRPSELSVRRATFGLGNGKIVAWGSVVGMAQPWPDSLVAPAVTRWLATGSRWEGMVEANAFPLERVEPLMPRAQGLGGVVSGRLAIAGTPARPELTLTADAQPLAWHGYRVDDLRARVRYQDERLEVEEIRMNRKSLATTITGTMPLVLALGARPVLPDQPMALRVDMPNGDLSVLPLFVPQIGSAAGRLEVAASIKGTPRHPDLDGTVRVRDGQIRIAGRDEVLTQVYADLRLDESRITLDSLAARQGEKGRVRGHGEVLLAETGFKNYRFELTMRDFTAAETGLYVVEFDGDFTVTDGVRMNRQILPHVVGTMEVKRAIVLFDFANQSEIQRLAATARPLFWTYRIQLNATHNLKWQPPDGDIEFSANLLVEQTPERLNVEGEMHALRGTYYFLSNRFTVTRADLTFHSFDGANPTLDAEATTRIVPTGQPAALELGNSDGRAEPHLVTVRIKGKSTEPTIEFASDPNDWDEARILRELTVGRFYAGGVTLGDPLDNFLTRAINKTLSAEMSRAFRGYVSEWEVQREQGGILAGQGDVIVGVGTQITPNLLLRFRQRVPGLGREYSRTTTSTNPFERDVEAEFRINRFFYVTSELTQRRSLSGASSTVGSAPEFNVNLKARWEY